MQIQIKVFHAHEYVLKFVKFSFGWLFVTYNFALLKHINDASHEVTIKPRNTDGMMTNKMITPYTGDCGTFSLSIKYSSSISPSYFGTLRSSESQMLFENEFTVMVQSSNVTYRKKKINATLKQVRYGNSTKITFNTSIYYFEKAPIDDEIFGTEESLDCDSFVHRWTIF